jgi:hypothetical protein
VTFIDWSDSEGLFDLLLEFIRDEKNASIGDPPRQRFLTELLLKVKATNKLASTKATMYLRGIRDSIDDEFKDDPAVLHLNHFIDELEPIS